jgi:hypothetical protein
MMAIGICTLVVSRFGKSSGKFEAACRGGAFGRSYWLMSGLRMIYRSESNEDVAGMLVFQQMRNGNVRAVPGRSNPLKFVAV